MRATTIHRKRSDLLTSFFSSNFCSYSPVDAMRTSVQYVLFPGTLDHLSTVEVIP